MKNFDGINFITNLDRWGFCVEKIVEDSPALCQDLHLGPQPVDSLQQVGSHPVQLAVLTEDNLEVVGGHHHVDPHHGSLLGLAVPLLQEKQVTLPGAYT